MSAAERISTRVRWTPEEQEARVGLAAAYRLFAQLGWHELIYNHITVKVPGTEHFLINPFGLMYRQVKASNLVKIDLDGAIVGPASYPINPAGFVVHAAVHRARADVGCVMHTHTTAGLAVACQADGLLPLSFPSMFYTDRLAYHDFEGVTVDESECDRLAADLGDRYAMILRNHGLLACGRTLGDAFAELYHLQRACEVQIAAQSSGAKLTLPPHAVALRASGQHDALARSGIQNQLLWQAMVQWMDDLDPSFRD